MMGHFNLWGDPRAGQKPDTFAVGDKAFVKSHVPLNGGRTGTVTIVDDETGFVTLDFGEGNTAGFEPDDLVNKGKATK